MLCAIIVIVKIKTCLVCQKEFKIDNWRVGSAKYCSWTCYTKGRTSDIAYSKDRVCVTCGNKFKPTQWYQKSCSRKCFCDGIKKTKERECLTCGIKFMQVRIAQKYCSRKCSSPYKDKSMKKPKNVSLDNLWSKTVKDRAGNKCEYCGKDSGLNSHHIFSRSNKRVRWDLDNGICVCVLHHVFGMFSAHKSPIEFVEWLKEYRGIEWYERLRLKAKLTTKYNKPNKQEEEEIRRQLKLSKHQ